MMSGGHTRLFLTIYSEISGEGRHDFTVCLGGNLKLTSLVCIADVTGTSACKALGILGDPHWV